MLHCYTDQTNMGLAHNTVVNLKKRTLYERSSEKFVARQQVPQSLLVCFFPTVDSYK